MSGLMCRIFESSFQRCTDKAIMVDIEAARAIRLAQFGAVRTLLVFFYCLIRAEVEIPA